jgi:3-hydroxyanthranilate 3,4-dioxygenase
VNKYKMTSTTHLMKSANLLSWLELNRSDLQPPVGNKLLWGEGQHKVMLVGGPNARRDYHIERGEELFYQLEGDMVLEVMEKGVQRDILIKQGEFFRLPSDTPHSPQRKERTVGLVLERTRLPGEVDALRWYTRDGSGRNLYEESFFCTDLGQQLKPAIQRFNASEACRTGIPTPGAPESVQHEGVVVNSTLDVGHPVNLREWTQLNAKGKNNGCVLYDGVDGFEYTVRVIAETPETEWMAPHEKGEMFVYLIEGAGELMIQSIERREGKEEEKVVVDDKEKGSALSLSTTLTTRVIRKGDVVLIPAGGNFKIKLKNVHAIANEHNEGGKEDINDKNCLCIVVTNNKV